MKRATLMAALLCACGGSGGTGGAAEKKVFTYGSPAAPSTSEQQAESGIETNFSEAAGFAHAPDITYAQPLAVMTEALDALVFGGTPLELRSPPGALERADAASCFTIAGGTISFNCSSTTNGFANTTEGSITASGGAVTWNASNVSTGNGAVLAYRGAGGLAVGPSTISGKALGEVENTLKIGGATHASEISHAAIVNLTYQSTPQFCITGGSIELRRVWVQQPGTGSKNADEGLKMSWTGCGAYQVSHSQ